MVNLEIQNRINTFLSSRKDWSNPKFKDLILERFNSNNQEFNLDEMKLRGKIEDLYNAFRDPIKYDENGKIKKSNSETYICSDEKSILGFFEEPIIKNIKITKSKPVILTIKDYSELIAAIKCILWSLDNEPKTQKDLLTHIMIYAENNVILPLLDFIEGKDYTEINNAFNMAISTDLLHLHKVKNRNQKTVYLYYNPTDKRQGYFYKGELWKLKDLSEINNVKIGTIQRRFQKMSIENSIKKH